MKNCFFALLINFISLSMIAAPISKRYKVLMTEKGNLFFLNPTKMSRSHGSKAQKDLVFDITYLVGDEDSVSFTATVIADSALKIDSIVIMLPNKREMKVEAEAIYCEPLKRNYAMRTRFYVNWEEWKSMYKDKQPYTLNFGHGLLFSFKQKDWNEESRTIQEIMKVIELNP